MSPPATGPRLGLGPGLLAAAWATSLAFAGDLPSVSPVATRALGVLDRNCAGCHQSGKLELAAPAGGLGNILNFDELARDPTLVVPGRPDASKLYNRMLGGHRPDDVYGLASGGRAPSPDDIEAVRDWIDSLDAKPACATRRTITSAGIETARERWAREVGPEAAGETRFVSLAHLANACTSAAELAQYRKAVEKLIITLSSQPRGGVVETIGDDNALLAFKLGDAGWTAEQWADLATICGPGRTILAGDCLAFAAQSRSPSAPVDPAAAALADAGIDGASELHGLDLVRALRRAYERDVGLARAAGELGQDQGALMRRLASVRGDQDFLARRLMQGLLRRSEWERLRLALDGRNDAAVPASVAPTAAKTWIDISLVPDKTIYKTGDLATLRVEAGTDCHLTLVNIDAKGEATVLFPNDLEPENTIVAGRAMRIPADRAGYQLRLDAKGTETIVAICQRVADHPDGTGHDFEHRRFTTLGDWRSFLRTTAERETEWKRAMQELRRFKRRPRGKSGSQPLPQATGPEIEGRTAIIITVE